MPQNPDKPGEKKLVFDDKHRALWIEQFLADLPSYPPELVAQIATICEAAKDLPDKISHIAEHLKAHPERIRRLVQFLFNEGPMAQLTNVCTHVTPRHLPDLLLARVIEVIGAMRFSMFVYALTEKCEVDKRQVPEGVHDLILSAKVSPPIDVHALENLVDEIKRAILPIADILEKEALLRAQAAERKNTRLERELAEEKGGQAEKISRMRKEAERGASNRIKEAEQKLKAEHTKVLEAKNNEIAAATRRMTALENELEKARAQDPLGALAEADMQAQRKQVEREFRDQMEVEMRDKVLPWLERMEAAERDYNAVQQALRLSSAALGQARKEAEEKDLLLRWESEPQRALPLIERELAEVDLLIARTAAPTPALVQMHSQLRTAMDACRAALTKSGKMRPGGSLMVNALSATIKQLDYDNLTVIAASINNLSTNKVLTEDESIAISKMINDEVVLRKSRDEHQRSPATLLSADLHTGKDVDIAVDAYNFIHLAKQHFGKMGNPSKADPTKVSFGPDARAKLAQLVSVIPRKFPKARVILFLDGSNMEKAKPHDGVSFRLPKVQRFGEGQADAEIVDFVKKRERPGASTYIVSSDRQMQDVANRHLSVGVFARILGELR